MTPAGEKLDRFLATVIAEQKGQRMPELGGKKLAGEIGFSFASVRKALDEARFSLVGAVTELLAETKRIGETEKSVRSETASIKRMNDDVLGNAETTDQTVTGDQKKND